MKMHVTQNGALVLSVIIWQTNMNWTKSRAEAGEKLYLAGDFSKSLMHPLAVLFTSWKMVISHSLLMKPNCMPVGSQSAMHFLSPSLLKQPSIKTDHPIVNNCNFPTRIIIKLILFILMF